MSEAGSSTESKRQQLNLNVLKRHDASIVEIVESTSYVVLYRYAPKSDGEMAWVKTNIEGSMFLFKRSKAPAYGYFILNRHGVDSFQDDLIDEASLELTPDYIIVQDSSDNIHGIWIFEEEHRAHIGQRMIELCHLSKSSKSLAKAAASVPVPPPGPAALPASPASSAAASKSKPSGQSISVDMLFGGGSNASVQPNAHLPNQQDLQDSQRIVTGVSGVSLLDSLFGQVAVRPPAEQTSTTVHEQLRTVNHNVNSTQSANENALREMLGLGQAKTELQIEQPSLQSHEQQGQHYQQYAQQQQQQPLSQRPLQPYYSSPQQPTQQLQSHNMQPFYGQPSQQDPSPMQAAQILPFPGAQSGMRAPQTQNAYAPQERQAAQPTSNPHYVTAPLMPSVVLNKNRTSAQAPSSLPAQPAGPNSPQYQHGYAQPSPIAHRALSPPILRAQSPLRQSHSFRMGAESIPPPPLPPAESRPYQNGNVQQQDGVRQQQEPSSPLAQTTALDLLTEQLKKSTLYQPVSPNAAYQQSPILDRYAFRDQVMQNLQDARFAEALYQSYLTSKSQRR